MSNSWQVGHQIKDRWTIHKILGGPAASGMGIVYVVYDQEWQVFLAAKTFQDEVLLRSPSIGKRFVQEARMWINLPPHENVAEARFVDRIDGKPLLFLEYVSGGDLAQWIGRQCLTQDLPQVLRFAVQLCGGMIHALSHGIKAHRDIKPQNCLITEANTLKVTDFGLAKAFDDADTVRAEDRSGQRKAGRGLFGRLFGGSGENAVLNASTMERYGSRVALTHTGAAVGTPPYMAPEQFDNAKHADMRSDVYSFGIVLFEMVTGRLPFLGQTWQEFAKLHKSLSPPRLSRSSIHPLEDVIQACLAKDPGHRFSGFVEVQQHLVELYESLTGVPHVHEPFLIIGKGFEPELPRELVGNPHVRAVMAESFEEAMENAALRSIMKGESLFELGSYEEAVACFDNALHCFDNAKVSEFDPRRARAWNSKGAALGALDRQDEAIAAYDRALTIDPNGQLTWRNKGLTLELIGRTKEALECLDRALRIDPGYADAWYDMGVLLFNTTKQFVEALRCFEEARRLGHRAAAEAGGRCQQALGTLGKGASPSIDQAAAKGVARGIELLESERLEEALASFERAIEINPDDQTAWSIKGKLLNLAQRPLEAIASLDRALALNPRLDPVWCEKANVLRQMARHHEAIGCYDHALEINPRSDQAWYLKGYCLDDLGKKEEAIACFDRALAINAKFQKAWSDRGTVLIDLSRYEDALTSCERALEINGSYGHGWCVKGNALLGLHRFKEAIKCYERALQLEPEDAMPLLNKGSALANLGQYQEALVCLEQAKRLGVSTKGVAELMTWCRRMQKQG